MCKLNNRQANIDTLKEGIDELNEPSYKLGYYNWRLLMGERWAHSLYTDEVYLSLKSAEQALTEKAAEFAAILNPLYDENIEWYEMCHKEGMPKGIEGCALMEFEDWNGHDFTEWTSAYVWIEEVTE